MSEGDTLDPLGTVQQTAESLAPPTKTLSTAGLDEIHDLGMDLDSHNEQGHQY